jgi:hypothetical protein
VYYTCINICVLQYVYVFIYMYYSIFKLGIIYIYMYKLVFFIILFNTAYSFKLLLRLYLGVLFGV